MYQTIKIVFPTTAGTKTESHAEEGLVVPTGERKHATVPVGERKHFTLAAGNSKGLQGDLGDRKHTGSTTEPETDDESE